MAEYNHKEVANKISRFNPRKKVSRDNKATRARHYTIENEDSKDVPIENKKIIEKKTVKIDKRPSQKAKKNIEYLGPDLPKKEIASTKDKITSDETNPKKNSLILSSLNGIVNNLNSREIKLLLLLESLGAKENFIALSKKDIKTSLMLKSDSWVSLSLRKLENLNYIVRKPGNHSSKSSFKINN